VTAFGVPAVAVQAQSAPIDLHAPSDPYASLIAEAAQRFAIPAAWIRAIMRIESRGDRRVVSAKGAMGLMQLMPETARKYAVTDPYDPAANIEAGIKHLKALLERLPMALALAAYNAGEGAVQRFHGIPPYPETQLYVSRILQLAR
jgi:soluble lytic murein transglycosylase-like protein